MSFDVQRIKDQNGYIIFFKVIENEYVKSCTEKGQIYFGTLSGYRNQELKDSKHAVGDRNEASLTHKVSEYIIYEDEIYEIHGKTNGYNIKINNNQCAFCFYAVEIKDFEAIGENARRYIIPYNTIKKFCKDKGSTENCSIIIFGENVIHKIYDQLASRKMKYAGQKVIYDDFDYIPKYDINSLDYSLEAAFHKERKYSYQKEFRIATLNKTNEPITDLYIPVQPEDFQVLTLSPHKALYCDIQIDADVVEKLAYVKYSILSYLQGE